jgi:hypothetical protein
LERSRLAADRNVRAPVGWLQKRISAPSLQIFDVPSPHFNYPQVVGRCESAGGRNNRTGYQAMTDLIFIAVLVLFFAVSGWYVRFCDKM